MRRALQAIGLSCLTVMLPTSVQAAQGPGIGGGPASVWTQLAMAVVVYGGAAIMIAAGLIDAVRPNHRTEG